MRTYDIIMHKILIFSKNKCSKYFIEYNIEKLNDLS